MSARTPTIGIWAANLSVFFAACFSIIALAANFTTLIPAIWEPGRVALALAGVFRLSDATGAGDS